MVFPLVIYSGISVFCMYVCIHFGWKSVIDGGYFFLTKIRVCHLGRGFSSLIFLRIALSALGCKFLLAFSSSICNSVSMLFIPSAFCYDLSVPIFCSKIFLPLSNPVVIMFSPILVLFGKIFFRCFGTSCFVDIVWSCLGIFLVFLLSLVFLVCLLLLFFSSSSRTFSVSFQCLNFPI